MRMAFVQEAVLAMAADGDLGAPGAAITVELCGHWEHRPPCPVAPHHTSAERVAGEVRLRTLFATEPDRETTVRQGIELALARGELRGPAGPVTRWRLCACRPGDVLPAEADHARRLSAGSP